MFTFGSRHYTTWTLLLAGGLLIAVVTGLIVGTGSSIAVNSLAHARTLEQNQILARNVAEDLSNFIEFHQQTVEVVAAHLAKFDGSPTEPIDALLALTRGKHVSIDRLVVVDARFRSIAASPATTADGASAIGLDYSNRDYLQEAVRTGRAVVSKRIIVGKAAKRPLVAIAVPVLDASGGVKFVVICGILTTRVQNIAALAKVGRGTRTQVASATGTIIAHDDRTVVEQQKDFSDQPVWHWLAAKESGRIPTYTGTAGDQRIAGFATVDGVGWKVWLSQPMADLLEETLEAYRGILLWLGLAVLAALAITLGLTRVLSGPINSLRSAADAVAGGALDRRAAERGPRELVALGRALNGMAGSLQRMVENERSAKHRLGEAVATYGAVAARVAGGDLTARITVSEEPELAELGHSINRMVESLGRVLGEIQDAAASLVSASSEILAATNQQVSATAEEAAAVKQTAATVAQVRQTAVQAAQKAHAVAEAAQRTAQVAQDGRRAVEESVRGSADAKVRMEGLAERILGFSEQVQAIAEINATVNDLAEQSNLLAVNAGIEAAKAGEAGKGFAVVAAELKTLADQCKQATAQVRGILAEIQRATHAAVVAAEQVVKTTEGGAATAARSGEAIRQLSESVAEATQVAQQIVASAQQQTVGMDQIGLAMRNIEQASGQTLAGTAQVQRSARDLAELAEKLKNLTTVTRVRQA